MTGRVISSDPVEGLSWESKHESDPASEGLGYVRVWFDERPRDVEL